MESGVFIDETGIHPVVIRTGLCWPWFWINDDEVIEKKNQVNDNDKFVIPYTCDSINIIWRKKKPSIAA
jgi:hypothetical protein